MPKSQTEGLAVPVHRQGTRSAKFFVGGLLLLLSPFLYETGVVVVANWQSMTGRPYEPHTPVLMATSEWVRSSYDGALNRAAGALSSGHLSATTAVPVAVIWAALMVIVFLRKSH